MAERVQNGCRANVQTELKKTDINYIWHLF
jgi:hypothetical protein